MRNRVSWTGIKSWIGPAVGLWLLLIAGCPAAMAEGPVVTVGVYENAP